MSGVIGNKLSLGVVKHNDSNSSISSVMTNSNSMGSIFTSENSLKIGNIANNINNLKFENILGIKYFPNINETGKNILLIGEQHMKIDNTEYLLKFFTDIIEKCQERGKCLDFFIESNLKYKNIIYNNDIFITSLRNLLREYDNNKDINFFRLHYIDIRDSTFGKNINFQYDSFINLINIFIYINFEEHDFMFYTIMKNLLDDVDIFNYFLGIGIPHNIEIGRRKYLGFELNIIITSFKEIINYQWTPTLKNNIELNIDTWWKKINEEIINFNNNIPYVNNNIIKRQMDNVDGRFFNREDLYDFSIIKFNSIKERIIIPKTYLLYIFVLYTDIYTIPRLFRDFENKGHPCDNLSNTYQNIILYEGNTHIKNIEVFIQNYVLHRTFPKNYNYFGLNQEKESSIPSSIKYRKNRSSKYGPTYAKKKIKKGYGK